MLLRRLPSVTPAMHVFFAFFAPQRPPLSPAVTNTIPQQSVVRSFSRMHGTSIKLFDKSESSSLLFPIIVLLLYSLVTPTRRSTRAGLHLLNAITVLFLSTDYLPRVSYTALGLVHTLNPLASGGAEYDPAPSISVTTSSESSHSQPAQAGRSIPASVASIPKGYGKIIRDSDGNVIRVELGADVEDEIVDVDAAGGDELQEPELDKQVMTNWVTELGGGRRSGADVVKCESASSWCLMLLFRTLSSSLLFWCRARYYRLCLYTSRRVLC
jgi:hypothetical protein